MQHKILSVGGSIIIPKTGFDIPFLKKFRAMILRRVKKGERFILVIGGGATCRYYQRNAHSIRPLPNEDLDWIGIATTKLNAEFVRAIFGEYAHREIIGDPDKRVSAKQPILIAAGFMPGHSTDTDAVILAKTYGAKSIVNLSNIDYAYDKDPNKFSDAKKIEYMNWKDFRKNIVGNVWRAGANAPFDPIASREAEKLKLTVSFLNGTNLKEVEKALAGKKCRGTIITP